MRLYQITEEYEDLLNSLYDVETGEVNEKSLARLSEVKESFEQKCIAIASYIENLDAERKAIEEAKKNMADRESRYKKQVANLKAYLLGNMERSQINKISCPYFDIKLCKNPPSVEYYDEKAVPAKYDRVKVEKDTAKIREDLLNGATIPGVRLVQRNSVRIK